MVKKVAAMKVRDNLGQLLDQERFKILDQIKAKTRRIPAKRLDATIAEAVRASRARR